MGLKTLSLLQCKGYLFIYEYITQCNAAFVYYREGVVTNKPVKPGYGSLVNVGLLQNVSIDKLLTAGIRCTVKLHQTQKSKKRLKGTVVAPNTPRQETGVYWGYSVRLATSLSQVLSQCPYKKG